MILVVDDDAMTLKLVEHTLIGGGHEVVATANPKEAALLAASHQVDAVILDVMMPGRSGFEVLKDLHTNPETKRLPVLMLSSLGEAEDRVKGLRGGADEYIGKPFDPEELLLRLNRLIDGHISDRPEFQGRLDVLSFAEVIQSLLHNATNGVLEVGSGDRRGTLVVVEGRPIAATWGRLEGIEAVLTMMDLSSGTFRFDGQVPSAAGANGPEIPIQKVMFTAAWLVDELSRWPEVDDQVPLSIRSGTDQTLATAVEWGSIPVEAVFDEIRSNHGISIRGIEAMERWAPKTIALAVRFMVHSGVIDAGTKGVLREDADGDVGVSCGQAVEAVIRSVERRGFSSELPHVLILVEPTVYGAFLEVRQALPPENLAVSGESITAAWRGGRVATLALRGAGDGLIIHVVSLASSEALKQVKARMADYPAVMAWVGDPERIDELTWVFEWIEMAPTPQWGILTVPDGEIAFRAEEALKWKKRWRLHTHAIATMEDLLGVIAEG
ncbi:MAG: response regulator [Acidobacteria bacterium]|nr:response regulator [Acidobacteriota bacterium]